MGTQLVRSWLPLSTDPQHPAQFPGTQCEKHTGQACANRQGALGGTHDGRLKLCQQEVRNIWVQIWCEFWVETEPLEIAIDVSISLFIRFWEVEGVSCH